MSEPSLVRFSIFFRDLKIIIKKLEVNQEDGRKTGRFGLLQCL